MNAYKKKDNLLFKRDGTCQVERLPQNLVNNGSLIDEKTLDEHVTFIYLYSDLIKYYGSHNTAFKHNAWRNFLENDDTVIFSLILHTKITQLRSSINNDFLVLKKKKVISSENKYTKRLLRVLQELMLLINYWYQNLSTKNNIKLELHTLITYGLNDRVTLLYSLLQQRNSQPQSETFLSFGAFVESICKEGAPWKLASNPLHENFVGDTLAQNTVSALRDLFDVILGSLLNLQKLAKEGYPNTLRSQQHKPQTALLIAFLRLLQYVSARINQIPQRHLDFYYKEVLKFRNQPVQADKVIVHFQLQEGINHYFLPAGTKLSAGKDDEGHDILFRTNNALLLNRATISKVHRVQQAIQVQGKDGFLPVGSICATTYKADELNKQKLSAQSNQKSTTQPGKPIIGLVVASPILYLREGNREINLKFRFSEKPFETFLENIKQGKEESIDIVQDRIALLFKQVIDVQLTSEELWFKLPPTYFTTTISTQEKNCLEIRLSLPPDIPPVVEFNQEVHNEAYDIQAPAIKFSLNNAAHLGHAYLLKDLALTKITLEVKVKDYRGLVLQNDLGLVDSSQPFQPFGSLPQLHSNFYLGSNELFSKDLKSLKLNIAWENLPTVDAGWQGYYQGYLKKVANEDFKVGISYLNHRQWHPFYAEHRQQVALFSVSKEGEQAVQKLQSKHVIDEIDIDRLNLTKAKHQLSTSLLTPKTLSGFLRLELCGPDMAFGHTIYPSLMSGSFIQNANDKKQFKPPALNEPYTPLIKSLSVDYSAREEILLTSTTEKEAEDYSQTLIACSPFGYKEIFPHKTRSVPFLSASESVGCFLCFGFEHLSTSLIALHIQIDENSIDPDKDFPKPTWQYLSYNDWINFRDDEIISDGTDGLAKSGIIVLSIPEEANTDHTLLSSGLVWVKALFLEDLTLPDLMSIHTQAVVASRIIDKDQIGGAPMGLRPGTIQSVVGSPAAIKAVLQPFASFGGRPAETPNQFYTRISERLRHKNRAISAWDYERLILEKFPEILRVKCVNHSSKANPSVPHPSRVTIVVIGKLQSRSEKNEFTPRVSKQLFREIEAYLKSVASPFVDFEVISPMYEEVKVNVEVKFKPLYEKGIYLNRLQRAIKNFLSPWLFNKTKDVRLGSIIPASKIIDFINKNEFVEGIGKFSILKYTGKGPTLTITKITDYDNYLKATYPWSVIVSADKHKISVVDKIRIRTGLYQGGIEDMGIGEDFIIGPWQEGKIEDWEARVKKDALQESLEEYYLVTKKSIKNTTYGHS